MKPTQSKHTPTPWNVLMAPNKDYLTYNNGKELKIASEDQKDSFYCLVGGLERTIKADFIVTACNAHESAKLIAYHLREWLEGRKTDENYAWRALEEFEKHAKAGVKV